MKKCPYKHLDPQPSPWVCPRCGATNEANEADYGFHIDDSVNLDCELVHVEDYIVCDDCDSDWTGAELLAEIAGSV